MRIKEIFYFEVISYTIKLKRIVDFVKINDYIYITESNNLINILEENIDEKNYRYGGYAMHVTINVF